MLTGISSLFACDSPSSTVRYGHVIPKDRPVNPGGQAGRPGVPAGAAVPGVAGIDQAHDLERERAAEALALARFRKLPGFGQPVPGMDLVPEQPYPAEGFDRNGAVYYFGTDFWTQPFDNPGRRGKLIVNSSPLANQSPSEPAWAITGRDCVRCVTTPSKDSWFTVDFVRYTIRPTHYALRHYASFDREALRNWVFEGSNNGKKWTALSKHVNDSSLYRKGQVHVFPVRKAKNSYRMFRVQMTGPNSNNNLFMALSGFEVYAGLAANLHLH